LLTVVDGQNFVPLEFMSRVKFKFGFVKWVVYVVVIKQVRIEI